MRDNLTAVVLAAQRGHDCAYPVLITRLKGLIFQVHHQKISGRMTSDEWYSEAMEVLMRCVARYDLKQNRAKFSTYYASALSNRATDLIRHYYTAKNQFHQALYAPNDNDNEMLEVGTNAFNPEHINILRDALDKVKLANSSEFHRVVLQLLGVDYYQQTGAERRRFDQMQYRFKQAVQAAI